MQYLPNRFPVVFVLVAASLISACGGGQQGADTGVADTGPRADAIADSVSPADVPVDSPSDTGALLDVSVDSGPDQDVALDTSTADTAPAADVARDSRPADTGPTCSGTHPLLDAGARFCGPSDCYCPLPGTGGDTCFPRATAAACCAGRAVVCGDMSDAGTCPAGTHPLLDGGARFCAPGSCRCPSTDACRPMAVAAACCPEAVVCF